MNEWISVDERLPEMADGENVSADLLVCGVQQLPELKGDIMTTIGWYFQNGSWDFVMDGKGNFLDPVTHWMPLPDPPQEAK